MDDPSDQLKEKSTDTGESKPEEETPRIEPENERPTESENPQSEKSTKSEDQAAEPLVNDEFTYFSLGSKPDETEETEETKPVEINEATHSEQINLEDKNQADLDQVEETKEDLEPKETVIEQTKLEIKDNESASILDYKKLSIDDMIEKVRNNQVANKDVCNYVLNMLVDGEFDLEKNFVIKNHTTILLMMQVIKCADNKLKAELWSLFTAILRKSYLNLQACVDIGLIETALHELEGADQVCADLIVEMLTVLANYNINVEELKAIFSWLKGEDQSWVGSIKKSKKNRKFIK